MMPGHLVSLFTRGGGVLLLLSTTTICLANSPCSFTGYPACDFPNLCGVINDVDTINNDCCYSSGTCKTLDTNHCNINNPLFPEPSGTIAYQRLPQHSNDGSVKDGCFCNTVSVNPSAIVPGDPCFALPGHSPPAGEWSTIDRARHHGDGDDDTYCR